MTKSCTEKTGLNKVNLSKGKVANDEAALNFFIEDSKITQGKGRR